MTAALDQVRNQMMSLPADDRREVLLATLESSGEEFSGDFLDAMESARRADERASGSVKSLTREEVFASARRALR